MNVPSQLRTFWLLIRFELKKMTRLKRFYIAFGILLCFIGMIALAMYQKRHRVGGRGEFGELLRELLNATTFSQIMLVPCALIILPVVIGIFTASSFSGEERLGLIRTMAIRPTSRHSLILSRFLSMTLFSYLMLGALLLVSYLVGGLIFGFDGEVFCLGFKEIGQKRFYVLTPFEGVVCLFRTYFLAGFSLSSIVALFLMFAILLRKQGNAIVAALGFYFVSFVLYSMPMMENLRPYLPVTYMMLWRYAMGSGIMWNPFLHDLLILGCFTFGYLLLGALVFRKRSL